MAKIKAILSGILSKKTEEQNGLFAELDELLAMRKYLPYVKKSLHNLPTSLQSGDVKSAFKGRGIELEEVREYASGDDVRDIDWRVSARRQKPFSKVYLEEKDREVEVLADLSSKMLFGSKKQLKSVTVAQIAALLGWLSLEKKDRFGAIIFDGQNNYHFKAEHNKGSIVAICKKLAEISKKILSQKESASNLLKSLKLLQKTIKNRAIVFVVGSFADITEIEQKELAALAQKSYLTIINVFDVLEEIAPAAGEYMVEDNGQSLVFSSGQARYDEAYRNYFAEKRSNLKKFCQKFNIKIVDIRTDIPLHKQFFV